MAGGAQVRTMGDLVYVGLNRRVIALDRVNGHVVWEWKAPKGSGFVSLLLDGDRLMVGVNGYMYCLDPVYGHVVWENPLKGYGAALCSIVSVNGTSEGTAAAAAIAQQQAAAAAASSGTAAGAGAG